MLVMKRFALMHKWITTIVLIVCVWASWLPLVFTEGYLDAHLDMAHRQYRELSYGLPPPWYMSEMRILQTRYSIQRVSVANCSVSSSLRWYARGYNFAAMASAKRRFGFDIFATTSKEAMKQWEQAEVSGQM